MHIIKPTWVSGTFPKHDYLAARIPASCDLGTSRAKCMPIASHACSPHNCGSKYSAVGVFQEKSLCT